MLTSAGAVDAVIYAITRHMIGHHRVSDRAMTFRDTWSFYDVHLSIDEIRSGWGLDMGMAARHAASRDQVLPDSDSPTTQQPNNICRDSRRYGLHIVLEPVQKIILMSLGRRI
jgi:hypothetical protein